MTDENNHFRLTSIVYKTGTWCYIFFSKKIYIFFYLLYYYKVEGIYFLSWKKKYNVRCLWPQLIKLNTTVTESHYGDVSVRAILSVPKGADDFIQGWLDTVSNLSLSIVVCSFINNIGNIWQIQSSYNVYTGTCVLNKAIFCFLNFIQL